MIPHKIGVNSVIGGILLNISAHKLDTVSIALSATIGFYGFTTVPRIATMILAVPVLCILADSRYSAFAVVLSYKLFASRGLLQGASVFLSESHSPLQAAMLYFFLSFAASLPFLVFWSRDSKAKALCLITAMLTAYVLPPISLIGIINPLVATGTIFKGWGFFGMLVILVVYAICAFSRHIAFFFLCVIVAFTLFPSDDWYRPPAPVGFVAIDTSFGKLASGSSNFAQDYERAQAVFNDLRKRNIKSMDASVVVLPETIAGRLNASGLSLWREGAQKLLHKDMTLIFGAEIPTGDGRRYDNAAVILYKGEITLSKQRIPVPYSMYRGPFAEDGANLHLFDDGMIRLPDGRKVAMIICYEAYLSWPFLLSMAHKPDAIVSIANLWWCRGTSLPRSQRTILSLWGLLFGVPVVFAQNSG